MPQPTSDFFEFQGLRFDPAQASILRMVDSAKFYIRPKQQVLLTTLLRRSGETVTYKELWAKIWPEIEDFDAVRRTMTETKSNLDKLLRSIVKSDAPIIQTISGQGYRIDVSVPELWPEQHLIENPLAVVEVESEPLTSPTRLESPAPAEATELNSGLLSPHPWHILGSCAIYASAYVCILLLETAYGSDQLWRQALRLSPLVFSWILITSITALVAAWKLTSRGNLNILALLILSFIASALILCGALIFFLPQVPITEATFQTQTAQGAYLKNVVVYFLPLATLFLLIPFHFVTSLRSNRINSSRVRELLFNRQQASALPNAIYISPRMLGFLLLIAGIACLPGTYWLLDHLRLSPHMNRFTLLVITRLVFYFGLGTECVLWYSGTINEIKASLANAQA